MIGCLLEAVLGTFLEVLLRVILWPVWLLVVLILATPYALIAALFDQTAYWPAVRERYRMTLIWWGGFPSEI